MTTPETVAMIAKVLDVSEESLALPETTTETAQAFDQAWAEYFAAHPHVLANWHHQNGYWPPI